MAVIHCKRRAVNFGLAAARIGRGPLTAPLSRTSPALKRKVQPRNRPDLPSSPPENFTMGRFAAVFIGILIVVGDAGAGPLPTFGSHGGGRWRAA